MLLPGHFSAVGEHTEPSQAVRAGHRHAFAAGSHLLLAGHVLPVAAHLLPSHAVPDGQTAAQLAPSQLVPDGQTQAFRL